MTAWAISQTTRFKAAIMGAGWADWHNFHALSNLSDWDMRFLQADPLDNPDVYRRWSPITYANRILTPTIGMFLLLVVTPFSVRCKNVVSLLNSWSIRVRDTVSQSTAMPLISKNASCAGSKSTCKVTHDVIKTQRKTLAVFRCVFITSCVMKLLLALVSCFLATSLALSRVRRASRRSKSDQSRT